MKEPKMCGQKELHQLFTRINTIVADSCEAAILVDRIEPILERFIDEYYCDVKLSHITTFLWVWFVQWREKRGDWEMLRRAGSLPQTSAN
jgi:hypothetical protein